MADSLFDLSGKTALITGSTRGIGRAIALQLARAGARVVICSRKAEACEAVRAEFAAQGLTAIAVPCNVGRREELEHLVARTIEAYGRIDVLVCNAATNPAHGPTAAASDEAFDKIMATNVRATWQLCNLVIPQMAERGDGAVIIVSSIAALKGNDVIGLYGVSKAAEAALTRNLAVEWGPRNVRVNAIAPGLVKTDFARALWEDETLRAAREAATPLRRLGEPEDIAGLALLLASPAGAFITGQTIVADGGVTIA
ncbi:MAG TPA: SDR family oxidoreductase [Burkholderiales bacterium]|jgi:NAD(P)-dependent dehydrogenase (short-subunit alcohol dehydrogenase family)